MEKKEECVEKIVEVAKELGINIEESKVEYDNETATATVTIEINDIEKLFEVMKQIKEFEPEPSTSVIIACGKYKQIDKIIKK